MLRCCLLLYFIFLPSHALADSPWIGQTVFLKAGAKGKVGNQIITVLSPTTVTRENGDWLWVGKAWVATKDVMTVDQALVYYTNEIKTNPDKTVWFLRGSAWNEKGEYDNAIKDYTEAIRLDPNYAKAYYNRAVMWHGKEEHGNAIKDFTQVIRLDPSDFKAYYERGRLEQSQGESDKALEDYTEAIRLDPEYAEAYHERGAEWYRKGEYDKAMKDYTEVIRLDPTNSYAYKNRGRLSHDRGDYDKALKDYNESIRLNASGSTAYNDRAWLQATCPDARFRNAEQAIKDATKACELTNWSNWTTVSTLGEAYAEASDFKNAIKWQKKAIELDTKNEWPVKHERLKLYESGKPFREPAVKK